MTESVSSPSPFDSYVNQPAPDVIRHLDTPENVPAGVSVQRVVFRSRTVAASGGPAVTEVYAFIASPAGDGPFPGLLVMHGGKGSAEEAKAIAWAKRGYVAVAPDIPGIADPEKVPESAGAWKNFPYGEGRWNVRPDVSHSAVFDAVVAGLQAFKLLQAQTGVDWSRLGIIGVSWGGYMTTMLSGLLGDQVKAAFSVFGCGHYEKAVFATYLDKLPDSDRETWLAELDASRHARNITSPFFIVAACNDSFFYPPAIISTLNEIPGERNVVFVPNADHAVPFPGGTPPNDIEYWTAMEVDYFAFYLKGHGLPLPVITIAPSFPADPRTVEFSVAGGSRLTQVSVYVADTTGDWKSRRWTPIAVTPSGAGCYQAILPEEIAMKGFWFAMVTDERPLSVSSRIMAAGNAAIG